MSLFKPGRLPPGVRVSSPNWPRLERVPPQSAEPSGGQHQPEADRKPPQPPESNLQAEAEKARILREARFEAARILQEAAEEAEQAVEAARREGYEAGRQEGLARATEEMNAQRQQLEAERQQLQAREEQMRAEVEALRKQVETEGRAIRAEAEAEAQRILAKAREEAAAILEEGRREQHRRLDEAQDALVELAVAAAMRLVQGHLAIRPDSVVNMIAAGLRMLKEHDCTVRVHPEDLPLLEAQRSTLEREMGGGRIQFQPDESLNRGDYVISSPVGQVDGRVERQVGYLRTALKAAMGGAQP